MLPMLQKLFAAKKQVEPAPVNGKVTLADVLRLDWFDLWYQPKIDLRGALSGRRRGAGARQTSRRQHDQSRLRFCPVRQRPICWR